MSLNQALTIQERELGAEHPRPRSHWATSEMFGACSATRRVPAGTTSRRWMCSMTCHGAEHTRTRWMLEQLAALNGSS